MRNITIHDIAMSSIALSITGLIIYTAMFQIPVNTELMGTFLLIVGFYFGSKSNGKAT